MISKQAVLDVLKEMEADFKKYGDYLEKSAISDAISKINAIPSISDGWISVEAGDFVVFEYYTETKCIIDKGLVIWINDNECCVETGINKKKRHQMEVSALRRKLIDLPPAPTK